MLGKKKERIQIIEKYGKTRVLGCPEMIDFLSGKKLSPLQAIKAECYDCQGWYADAVEDCKNPMCPLYPFMPYSPKTKDPARIEAGKKIAAMHGFKKQSP